MSRIIVFGAGNIGRSFIGQVFARGAWDVVFVDVDPGLVAALNERRAYPVVVKRPLQPDETIWVRGVRAVDGRDISAVAAELAAADLAATSVGKAALPRIVPAIAAGLLARWSAGPAAGSAAVRTAGSGAGAARHVASGPGVADSPAGSVVGSRGAGSGASGPRALDLILAENDREAPETMRRGLAAALPPGFPLEERLGLVETSIGKMVPIMRAADLAADRLRVFSEAYNELIVDRRGFLGPLPRVPDLRPVDNILAYVDRKLFVHNLGHAAVAYLGRLRNPAAALICEALALPGVRDAARGAMSQAAAALAAEYPADLTPTSLEEHIEDLLGRFANTALGDTVFRVGRDLPRKLHRSDRIVGAALLCERHGLPWDAIAEVFRAALRFDAVDESGHPFPGDVVARELLEREGIEAFMTKLCALDPGTEPDRRVRARLAEAAAR